MEAVIPPDRSEDNYCLRTGTRRPPLGWALPSPGGFPRLPSSDSNSQAEVSSWGILGTHRNLTNTNSLHLVKINFIFRLYLIGMW